MRTVTEATRLYVFNTAAPELSEEMNVDYYQECRIAGAGGVEVKLQDHSIVIISATRYLPADVAVGAVVTSAGVLQVICTPNAGVPVVMREFSDWSDYTVRRARG